MTADNEDEILLVEDDPGDAKLILFALAGANLPNKIHHVWDGAEALDYIFGTGAYAGRAAPRRPRLVLLDLNIPKVNGLEVLERVKADKSKSSIPVVVMTSSELDKDLEACYEFGVNSYIVKPIDFERLSEAVAQLSRYWVLLNRVPR